MRATLTGRLDLLQRGCSSHRQRGNLVLPDSSYTPHIVRFCTIDRPFLCLDLCRPPALWRGTFLRLEVCQQSSCILRLALKRFPFQSIVDSNELALIKFVIFSVFLDIIRNPSKPTIRKTIIAKPVSIEEFAPSKLSIRILNCQNSLE